MEEKFKILLEKEHLTASKLAEILQVQPASISHIIKGRNKPSFELISKLVTKFPRLNPYWLLGNSDEMYNPSSDPNPKSEIGNETLSDDLKNESPATPDFQKFDQIQQIRKNPKNGATVEKIVIVYSDHTFETLEAR